MPIQEVTALAVIDPLLKVMQGEVSDQMNLATPLIEEFMKRQKIRERAGGGRSVERPKRLRANLGMSGVMGDDGAMAKATRGSYDKMIIPVYPHNASGKIGHIGELKSKQDVQAIGSVLERMTKDIIDGFPITMNQTWWRDGRGVVARVNGTPNLTTMVVTVDQQLSAGSGSTLGTIHLNEGAWYQATSDATLAKADRVAEFQASGIDEANLTFIATGFIGDLADGDYIAIPDGLNNVSDGILSVNEGFKDTYLNVDRTVAANAWAKSTRFTSVGAADLEEKLIEGLLKVNKDIGGWPTFGLTGTIQFRRLWEAAKDSRRFITAGDRRKYALGFEALQVMSPGGKSVEIFIDRFAPGDTTAANIGMLVVLDPDDWEVSRIGAPGWYKGPNGSLTREISGTYGLQANWLDVNELGCDVPKRQLFFEGINTT